VRALKKAGLPEELSWLPLIESGFKVRALSRARALGLWQFIASTGYKFGLKRNYWIDERMDPEKATRAAIDYLKELHQIFGDWTTALAAYNCGEDVVLKSIRTQKINYLDHFWDLYAKLPIETAFYVPKFMAILHILNDPQVHGFILPPLEEEIKTEVVNVAKQVHLKTMAKYLGIPYEVLKDLNPALRHNSTSIRAIMALNGLKSAQFIKAGWKLKIPTRRRYATLKKTSQHFAPSAVKGKLIEYKVQKGDSLWIIANKFGTITSAIYSANQLSSIRLRIGQVLMIPTGLTTLEGMKTEKYTVLKGDSPSIIAQKHHMKLSQFLRLNNLTPRSTIYPGRVVLVKAE